MRTLVLYKNCSILRGLMDVNLIPKDIAFPVSVTTVSGQSLTVTSETGRWSFNLAGPSQ